MFFATLFEPLLVNKFSFMKELADFCLHFSKKSFHSSPNLPRGDSINFLFECDVGFEDLTFAWHLTLDSLTAVLPSFKPFYARYLARINMRCNLGLPPFLKGGLQAGDSGKHLNSILALFKSRKPCYHLLEITFIQTVSKRSKSYFTTPSLRYHSSARFCICSFRGRLIEPSSIKRNSLSLLLPQLPHPYQKASIPIHVGRRKHFSKGPIFAITITT